MKQQKWCCGQWSSLHWTHLEFPGSDSSICERDAGYLWWGSTNLPKCPGTSRCCNDDGMFLGLWVDSLTPTVNVQHLFHGCLSHFLGISDVFSVMRTIVHNTIFCCFIVALFKNIDTTLSFNKGFTELVQFFFFLFFIVQCIGIFYHSFSCFIDGLNNRNQYIMLEFIFIIIFVLPWSILVF